MFASKSRRLDLIAKITFPVEGVIEPPPGTRRTLARALTRVNVFFRPRVNNVLKLTTTFPFKAYGTAFSSSRWYGSCRDGYQFYFLFRVLQERFICIRVPRYLLANNSSRGRIHTR